MKSETEIADAHELLEDVLAGTLDLGDVPEEVGVLLAATADALGWVLDHEDALLGINLTNLRMRFFTELLHGQ